MVFRPVPALRYRAHTSILVYRTPAGVHEYATAPNCAAGQRPGPLCSARKLTYRGPSGMGLDEAHLARTGRRAKRPPCPARDLLHCLPFKAPPKRPFFTKPSPTPSLSLSPKWVCGGLSPAARGKVPARLRSSSRGPNLKAARPALRGLAPDPRTAAPDTPHAAGEGWLQEAEGAAPSPAARSDWRAAGGAGLPERRRRCVGSSCLWLIPALGRRLRRRDAGFHYAAQTHGRPD